LKNGTLGHQEILRAPKRVRRAWRKAFLQEGWLAGVEILERHWRPVLRCLQDYFFTEGLQYAAREVRWIFSKQTVPRYDGLLYE